METEKRDYHGGKSRESDYTIRHTYDKRDGHLTIEISRKAQNDRFRDYSTSSGD